MVNRAEIKPITEADIAAMEAQGIMREVVDGKWVTEEPETSRVQRDRIRAALNKMMFQYPNVRIDSPESGAVIDIAIEIISLSERFSDIRAKLEDYLQSGVRQVWQVIPDRGEVIVNFPDGRVMTYSGDDKIPGGDALPEFELTVSDIFPD
jgi:Uma2 family endonuclease